MMTNTIESGIRTVTRPKRRLAALVTSILIPEKKNRTKFIDTETMNWKKRPVTTPSKPAGQYYRRPK